ncbi:hypothetical protein [Thermocrinis sp.]|jgi:cytochrome c oxidase subunit 1|uniref:hypothetical protein n=1 Tax=Thermocrinis sp. TaxID=2024383 RepID=UPI003C0F104B
MIGAKELAFPRLNAFVYWAFFGASALAVLTLIPQNWIMMLWTGYPPYSINENAGPTILNIIHCRFREYDHYHC